MWIFVGLLISVALTAICAAVASAKGRNPYLWGILGFFFGLITLIVVAACPSVRPRQLDIGTNGAEGVRHCPQCDAENHWEATYCTSCGARLRVDPEMKGRGFTPARFLTPLAGLIVGLIFSLILLEVTTPSASSSAESLLGGPGGEDSYTTAQFEALREKLEKNLPPVVLLWPVSTDLTSFFYEGDSVAREVWQRVPVTLEITILGGGLAVILAWGLGLGLRRRHPGVTAGRVSVASLAAVPVFCLALLGILSLVRYFDWMPPPAYSSFWDDPQTNILQLFWPIFAIGLLGGLWAALEMRSREDSSTIRWTPSVGQYWSNVE